MRPATLARFVLLGAVLLTCGCKSNNKDKIEVTRWTSQATTFRGQQLPAGTLELAFGGDGKLIYTVHPVSGTRSQTFKGTYSLGMADMVTFYLEEELAGSKTHVETIVITGNQMTMTDSD